MELSKTHIQKINNFLEAMDIEYIDIRLEMIDHIATEIEQNFTNIPAFFDGRGFQVPFVKFMMSKKPSLINEYKNQVKRKKWADYGFIAKKMALKLVSPLLLIFSLIIGGFCWYFAQNHFVPTIIGLFVLTFVFSLYFTFLVQKQTKKTGKIKLLHSYTIVSSILVFISVESVNLSGFIIGKTSKIGLVILIIITILQFLLLLTYLSEKEKINQKYSYLITA